MSVFRDGSKQRYASVSEMLRDLCSDELADEFDEYQKTQRELENLKAENERLLHLRVEENKLHSTQMTDVRKANAKLSAENERLRDKLNETARDRRQLLAIIRTHDETEGAADDHQTD